MRNEKCLADLNNDTSIVDKFWESMNYVEKPNFLFYANYETLDFDFHGDEAIKRSSKLSTFQFDPWFASYRNALVHVQDFLDSSHWFNFFKMDA